MSIQIRLLAEGLIEPDGALEDAAAMAYSLMTMFNAFTWTFLAALLAATATRLWLSQRQIRHVRAHRGAVPPTFADAIPLAAHQKAADYTVAKTKFGMVDNVFGAALLVVLPAVSLPCMMILGGTLRRLRLIALLTAAVMLVGMTAGLLLS